MEPNWDMVAVALAELVDMFSSLIALKYSGFAAYVRSKVEVSKYRLPDAFVFIPN